MIFLSILFKRCTAGHKLQFGSKVSWPLWWKIAKCDKCNKLWHLGSIDWEWHTATDKNKEWWISGVEWE